MLPRVLYLTLPFHRSGSSSPIVYVAQFLREWEYPDGERMGRSGWCENISSYKLNAESHEDSFLLDLTVTVHFQPPWTGMQLTGFPVLSWKEEEDPIPKVSLKESSAFINQVLLQGPHWHLQHLCFRKSPFWAIVLSATSAQTAELSHLFFLR